MWLSTAPALNADLNPALCKLLHEMDQLRHQLNKFCELNSQTTQVCECNDQAWVFLRSTLISIFACFLCRPVPFDCCSSI